jgi:hypothetical protein
MKRMVFALIAVAVFSACVQTAEARGPRYGISIYGGYPPYYAPYPAYYGPVYYPPPRVYYPPPVYPAPVYPAPVSGFYRGPAFGFYFGR